MRTVFPFLALLLTAAPLVAQSPQTLAAMRDQYRPILVFEGGDAKQTEQQLTALASHAAALRERQVIVVGAEGTDKSLPTALLPEAEWKSVQQRFHVKPDEFTVILLGKDGGEKLRSHQPFTWEKLQKTIDAMPMRRDEAQTGKR